MDLAIQPTVCGVVVCGGQGERFGNPGGKQLVTVNGLPLMSWSLKAFDSSPVIGCIVVVVPFENIERIKTEAIDILSLTKQVIYAPAQPTRQLSVLSGLDVVPHEYEYVCIHDGARPLVSVSMIKKSIEPFQYNSELDGVICGYPAIDTLKIVDEHMVLSTPNRASYWEIQTPQSFRRSKIQAVHAWAQDSCVTGTDDASLVEKYGGSVMCVQTPRDNIKVTVPEDLVLVEALLAHRCDEQRSSL